MRRRTTMSGPQTTLLIEGSFRELVEELTEYIDNVKKNQGDSSASLHSDVATALDKYTAAEESQNNEEAEAAKEEVLKVVVPGSEVLNAVPERGWYQNEVNTFLFLSSLTVLLEFIAAYNLLIHLIQQSTNLNEYLPSVCRSLSSDVSSSPNRSGLALAVLSTIFNVLQPTDGVRYPVFSAILDVITQSSNYDLIRPYLPQVVEWLSQWGADPAQQRQLYLRISRVAKEDGEEEEALEYLIEALRTIPSAETSSDEARKLSVDALKSALSSPTHFDFEDLTSLDSIQALRSSDPIYFQLLEIFTADMLDDFVDFKDEHNGWIDEQDLDDSVLTRKMRLLTFASLAASAGQSRSIPYSTITKALQIPTEDLEMWVIDVIRAGLVEGKLSQLNQTFLIHRSTYRVFRENQWREVAGRLDMWRTSLMGVLSVVRQEKENLIQQKEMELRAAEAKVNGMSNGGFRRQQQRDTIDVGMD